MYLCEVAIVSQLCISFPYELHGLCEDYLTCDIAFNAVMPLSRASTRERYSRIEGVTWIYLYRSKGWWPRWWKDVPRQPKTNPRSYKAHGPKWRFCNTFGLV